MIGDLPFQSVERLESSVVTPDHATLLDEQQSVGVRKHDKLQIDLWLKLCASQQDYVVDEFVEHGRHIAVN